jgi:hypothetical protein
MRIHRLKAELEREKTALTNLRRRQQHKRQVARRNLLLQVFHFLNFSPKPMLKKAKVPLKNALPAIPLIKVAPIRLVQTCGML